MTRPHSTHHDDCGCLSERHAQQIADANAAIKRLTRERDEAVRQARLSSLNATPGWEGARPIEKLAELMRHMGYADGDSGYTFRYLSYAEMDIIHDALLDRAALAASQAECAALREALTTVLAYNACPGIEIEPGRLSGCDAARTGATDCPTCSPLSRPPGSREALRAMLLQCAGAVWATAAPSVEMDSAECAAIVARLVPDAGQKGAEG